MQHEAQAVAAIRLAGLPCPKGLRIAARLPELVRPPTELLAYGMDGRDDNVQRDVLARRGSSSGTVGWCFTTLWRRSLHRRRCSRSKAYFP